MMVEDYGMSVNKNVNGRVEQFWLGKNTPPAVFMANSLFDWITGLIVDAETHIWPLDRHAFVGPARTSAGPHVEAAFIGVQGPSRAKKC
ncbi:MAG: hypothetical protein M1830_008759 [Pleopsidium flavum]|nr:MAG: hypothetical protein M1830_008759 [Pleopsidium flavum]